MVDGKKQLNTKIPQDLWDKLEENDTPKQNIVTDALRLYLDSQRKPEDSQSYQETIFEIAALRSKLESNEEIIRILKEQVKDLQGNNGYLISENQRINKMNERLLLPEPVKDGAVKKWWEFWR